MRTAEDAKNQWEAFTLYCEENKKKVKHSI